MASKSKFPPRTGFFVVAPTVRKNKRGGWAVYLGDRMVSDHATYDGAATSANQLITAESYRLATEPGPCSCGFPDRHTNLPCNR